VEGDSGPNRRLTAASPETCPYTQALHYLIGPGPLGLKPASFPPRYYLVERERQLNKALDHYPSVEFCYFCAATSLITDILDGFQSSISDQDTW
jgi:hypothetical protein